MHRSDNNGKGERMDIGKNNLQNIRGIDRNKEIRMYKQEEPGRQENNSRVEPIKV